jgi:hypothetical protein
MSILDINNGDSASGIREKLNEIIAIANHYSSSFITGSGDAGGGGGDSADSISLYSSGVATLVAESTSADACGTISTGTQNLAYIQKDASNMGGTSVPEVNDFLYSDSATTTALSDGWYGWYDITNLQNKSIEISTGQINTINTCA